LIVLDDQVKMFSSVGWDLAEGGTAAQQYPTVFNKTGDVYTIVRRNEFEHARATMSVVVQDHTGELHVYCKVSHHLLRCKLPFVPLSGMG